MHCSFVCKSVFFNSHCCQRQSALYFQIFFNVYIKQNMISQNANHHYIYISIYYIIYLEICYFYSQYKTVTVIFLLLKNQYLGYYFISNIRF